MRRNNYEELGLKVQRVHQGLEQVRGIGTVNGLRVVVDAQGRLLSVTADEEDLILAAYQAALADKQPKVDEVMRELHADPRFEAVSTFTEANAARVEAERAVRHRRHEQDDDDYYEKRNRAGWFEN
ncbi:YbaB/EbfC family nucleoid-associated protein [Nocardia alni]|uniref:YbaB/EbfC family nucleoid-associated protein n=1 Tax=Nocardia alni TaxID=2815723 RepID=UPI001C21979B|nr:YbaB/EbfC family nucleoid-associated protein [Nocardia alni]